MPSPLQNVSPLRFTNIESLMGNNRTAPAIGKLPLNTPSIQPDNSCWILYLFSAINPSSPISPILPAISSITMQSHHSTATLLTLPIITTAQAFHLIINLTDTQDLQSVTLSTQPSVSIHLADTILQLLLTSLLPYDSPIPHE